MYFEEYFDKAWNVRDFTNDQPFYKKIIEVYESKPDQPIFCFGISTQNHATYLTDYNGEVHLTGEYKDQISTDEKKSLKTGNTASNFLHTTLYVHKNE